MITVGLIKELNFISQLLKNKVSSDLMIGEFFLLKIEIQNQFLKIYHGNELIWAESLNETTGNFGIESCQNLMILLKNKVEGNPYKDLVYKEKLD